MNNRETIDGVQGEWRTVTKADIKNDCITRCRESKKHKWHVLYSHIGAHLLFHAWKEVQQFFPIAKPAKRKVAKVRILSCENRLFWWFTKINRYSLNSSSIVSEKTCYYKSRKSALRGARRFCKAIGYDCEVVK
jgi:hypothetical protein